MLQHGVMRPVGPQTEISVVLHHSTLNRSCAGPALLPANPEERTCRGFSWRPPGRSCKEILPRDWTMFCGRLFAGSFRKTLSRTFYRNNNRNYFREILRGTSSQRRSSTGAFSRLLFEKRARAQTFYKVSMSGNSV